MAGPPSSTAKSNPRCVDRRPVDISVRLADRNDGAPGRPSSNVDLLDGAADPNADDRPACPNQRLGRARAQTAHAGGDKLDGERLPATHVVISPDGIHRANGRADRKSVV